MGNEKVPNRSTRSNPVASEMGQMYELLNEIKNKLDCCYEIIKNQDKKISELQNEVSQMKDNSRNINLTDQSTYSDVTKRVNHVILVKPKNDRDSDSIADELKQNLNPTDLQIGMNINSVKSGGVIVKCPNSDDLTIVKNNIKSKMGDNYEVQEPKRLSPRIIIGGISEEEKDTEPQVLLQNIIAQNKIRTGEELKFKEVFRIFRRNGKFNVVIEVDPATFKFLMERENPELYIGFNICKIFEYFRVKRCFNCCGFNHESKTCKEKMCCANCAGNHKSINCNSILKKCANCARSNIKLNLSLDLNHSATDRNCRCYQRIVQGIKRKIDYDCSYGK